MRWTSGASLRELLELLVAGSLTMSPDAAFADPDPESFRPMDAGEARTACA
jgi:hypothetical protein